MRTPWLFLDDTRPPPQRPPLEWLADTPLVARSYGEFVAIVTREGVPEFISFDYELGEDKTGLDCALWLAAWVAEDASRLPREFNIDVHSSSRNAIAPIMHAVQAISDAVAARDDATAYPLSEV